MAYRTNQTTLRAGLERSISVAAQQKSMLQAWDAKLAGNITGVDALDMAAALRRNVDELESIAAMTGIVAYARDQVADQTYDVAGEFTAMIDALKACRDWLDANIPSNAVSLVNGALVGNTYTPAQTAPLRSLIQAAIPTID